MKDETSAKKGHDYETVYHNLQTRMIIQVSESREALVVKDLAEAIDQKKGDVKAISHAGINYSETIFYYFRYEMV